jgi:hypothetical protein
LLKAALDLFGTGLELKRQNLRRADPRATEREIEDRLNRWLRDRPGAELGDSAGRPVDVGSRFL